MRAYQHPVSAGGAVRFGVLGPLQVVDGAGEAITVSAAKQRIMLATLLLAKGKTVSAASLAHALWDVSPPPNVSSVTRTYVMRLRRALGPVGSRIVGQPPGWAVELHGPEEFDLAEVDGLWRTAQGAAAAGKWGEVSSQLAWALSLWRGEPLVDVPSDALVSRETGRLGELRLQLTEARIEADLNLGRHRELVAELQSLTAEQPLRERFLALRMVALTRCGRQAEALAAYRQARRALIEELGVEPGPELRRLHQQILQQDPDIAVTSPVSVLDGEPAESRPESAAQGAGSPVDEAAGAGSFGVPAFKQVCQLPADMPDFAGRHAECAWLAGLLVVAEGATAVPVAVVSGPPGVGKTCLAVHVAHALRPRFPGGQLYVELGGGSASPRAAGEVLGELLRGLGVPAGGGPGGG